MCNIIKLIRVYSMFKFYKPVVPELEWKFYINKIGFSSTEYDPTDFEELQLIDSDLDKETSKFVWVDE